MPTGAGGSGFAPLAAAGGNVSSAGKHRVVSLVVLVAGCAGYSTFRIWQAVATPPAVWQDSLDYHAVSTRGWLSTGLWTGSRPPLVPIVLKLSGSYAHFGIVQAVIGAAAWCVLALTASRLVAAGWRAIVVGFGVLAFASTPLVMQWDWSVLSESLSLSAEAMICASVIWIVRRFSWTRLTAMTLSVVAYVGIRDADIWEILTLGVVLLVIGVHATIRGAALGPGPMTQVVKARWARTRRWVLVGLALVVAPTIAQIGAYASHRNVVNVEQALYVRVFPFRDRVSWFASHGMPEGSAIDQLAASSPAPPKGQAKVVGVDLSSPAWHPLLRWFDTRAESTYLLFLVTHPGYVITAPFDSPPLTYNNASGNLSFYDPMSSRPLSVVELILAPDHYVVIFLSLIAISLAWRKRLWREHECALLCLLVAVGLVSMLLSWHGDGEEVTRHMVEGDVAVRLGVMLMFLYALFSPSRQVERPPESASERGALEDADTLVGANGPPVLAEAVELEQPVAR